MATNIEAIDSRFFELSRMTREQLDDVLIQSASELSMMEVGPNGTTLNKVGAVLNAEFGEEARTA